MVEFNISPDKLRSTRNKTKENTKVLPPSSPDFNSDFIYPAVSAVKRVLLAVYGIE